MKVLFVSLNSLTERSGGGLYVRSLCRGLQRCATTEIIAKGEGRWPEHDKAARHWRLPKGTVCDLLARLFGSASFIGAWFPLVLWRAAGASVVVFHNSRHGVLLALCRVLYPRTRFVIMSDNVEQKLNAAIRSRSPLRRFVQAVDALLIPLAERWSWRWADVHSFITADDRAYFEQRYGPRPDTCPIVPVYLPYRLPPPPRAYGLPLRILFTASFRHSPNISALHDLLRVATLCPDLRFVVAGLELERLLPDLPQLANVEWHPSPEEAAMQALFDGADAYFCPVNEGSGMKTKVAEALQGFLPALVSGHSALGYEPAVASGAVTVYADVDEAVRVLQQWQGLELSQRFVQRSRAGEAFCRFYSDDAGQATFAYILSQAQQRVRA